MKSKNNYVYKIADTEKEFEDIYKLNYATFVDEIQQHDPNNEKKLIDKFHAENSYIICLQNSRLIGMLAFREKRPFSLDYKFEQIDKRLDDFLPEATHLCEVRLLSIPAEYRGTSIFHGLMRKTIEYAEQKRFDLALISGILNQQKLYRNLGFKPFGPVVGNKDAAFQPMYLDLETFKRRMIPLINNSINHLKKE